MKVVNLVESLNQKKLVEDELPLERIKEILLAMINDGIANAVPDETLSGGSAEYMRGFAHGKRAARSYVVNLYEYTAEELLKEWWGE